ncbi:hypothetical protein [Maricaulis sp. CAU 1757]
MWTRGVCLGLMVMLAGCSTVPRHYMPIPADPVEADAAFAGIVETCSNLVSQGVRSDYQLAVLQSGALGAAAAYGTGAVIFVGAADTAAISLITASNVALVAMPVVGILVAVGHSRRVRDHRERAIRRAMTDCLSEHGYRIERWQRVVGGRASVRHQDPPA